jgi:hypothetical protein
MHIAMRCCEVVQDVFFLEIVDFFKYASFPLSSPFLCAFLYLFSHLLPALTPLVFRHIIITLDIQVRLLVR